MQQHKCALTVGINHSRRSWCRGFELGKLRRDDRLASLLALVDFFGLVAMCEECNNACTLGLLAQTAVGAVGVAGLSWANYDAVTVRRVCWCVLAVVYDNDGGYALRYGCVCLLHAFA